jgi:hypothetical protein
LLRQARRKTVQIILEGVDQEERDSGPGKLERKVKS